MNLCSLGYSLNELYRTVGISKQAIHQYSRRQKQFDEKVGMLITEVDELRLEHPGCGVEKMYYTLKPAFIGRDRFIDLFMDLGYRIRYKENYRRTTYSSPHSKYLNLIEGMLLSGPNQVWQSDITYIRVKDKFYYAVFIIDVYTKKLVGYNVSDSMRATANVRALKMSTKNQNWPLIHHSDRGGQYIYKPYIKMLESSKVNISMGLTAMDNAYAERINQTIKREYLDYWKPQTYSDVKKHVAKAVKNYNTKRIHNHIGRKTPQQFEQDVLALPIHDRPLATIYTNGQNKMEGTLSPLPSYTRQNLKAHICPIFNYEIN